MRALKSLLVLCFVPFFLVSCGGGGASSNGTLTPSTITLTPSPSFENTVTSGLAFPLQSSLRDFTKQGSSANYSISGDCTGTASTRSSMPTSATFEGGVAFSVSNWSTILITSNNCPLNSSGTYTYSMDYFDSNYLPLGSYSASGAYGLFLTSPVIPELVKVGDVGTIGTKNYYSNNAKTVATGYDTLSYVIEPDTADTAIVNLINKSFDQHGVLYYAEQNRYKIWSSGLPVPVSSDVQMPGLHLVLTAVPTPLPVSSSTSPLDLATGIPLANPIKVTFSHQMDPATVSGENFSLKNGGTPVAGTVTYSGTTATFTPSASLSAGTVYTATITTGMRDLHGNSLQTNYSWSFTTFASDQSALPVVTQSVAYQNNYTHSGFASFGAPLVFPASSTWSVTLNGDISYPLIVGGRVFVLSAGLLGGGFGTELYALDLLTGNTLWGPVAIPALGFQSEFAYDHGKLFVVNSDGQLRTFDAASGQEGWSKTLPTFVNSPPTATNGILYVDTTSHNILYAIDESNGNTLWTAAGTAGDSPTVTSDGVFVTDGCNAYKHDPVSGVNLWSYHSGCSTGAGGASPYVNGVLYSYSGIPGGIKLDAATGAQVGTFTAYSTPAFSTQAGFFLSPGSLKAYDLNSNNLLWSFAGDGSLISAPIVIDQTVIIGSHTGMVYAINAATGAQIWSGNAGAAIWSPDGQGTGSPMPGMGAGEGYLIVPAGNVLTAWKLSGP